MVIKSSYNDVIERLQSKEPKLKSVPLNIVSYNRGRILSFGRALLT